MIDESKLTKGLTVAPAVKPEAKSTEKAAPKKADDKK